MATIQTLVSLMDTSSRLAGRFERPLQFEVKMAVAVDLAYDEIWRRSSKFEPKLNLMSS